MENESNLEVLFIIVNAGFADEVTQIAREAGMKGATILNARGEGAQHESFLGITIDTEKEIVMSATDNCTAKKIMAAIKEKAGIKTPAHGICFTTPANKAVGLNISDE